MVFKNRVAVADYCTISLAALFSKERETTWDKLLTSCNDEHLKQLNRNVYYDNLRAIIIELMLIAITKECGSKSSTDANVFVMEYLDRRGLTHISSLQRAYSRAFGTPSANGLALMVRLFANSLSRPIMSKASRQHFYIEFYAILRGLLDDFKSIKLIPVK